MRQHITKRDLKFFGLTVGGIFGLIGLWPVLVRSEDPRFWGLALSGLLIGPALAHPQALDRPYRVWMAAGSVLGWINTRLILGALFYTLFLLAGLLMRLFGNDPMRRTFEPDAATYRIARRARPATHMRHQF